MNKEKVKIRRFIILEQLLITRFTAVSWLFWEQNLIGFYKTTNCFCCQYYKTAIYSPGASLLFQPLSIAKIFWIIQSLIISKPNFHLEVSAFKTPSRQCKNKPQLECLPHNEKFGSISQIHHKSCRHHTKITKKPFVLHSWAVVPPNKETTSFRTDVSSQNTFF